MKSINLNYLLLFLLIIFIGCKGKVVEKEHLTTPDFTEAIDSAKVLIQDLLDRYQTPGVAVSVSVGDELVWSEGFGYANVENEIVVDPSETKFRIGSVSKTLTATAIGKLYEEGKIDLDKIVQVYTPYFPEKRYPITVRQIAGHTAGIRHYRGAEFMSDKYYPTIREGLAIFENDDLLFEPDTKYSYSSYGWNLISAVVEEVAEENFLSYMTQIFQSLEMNDTEPDIAINDIERRTRFYGLWNGEMQEAPYVDNSYKWAGGGFISTSEDLVGFGNANLYNRIYDNKTFEVLTASHKLKDGSSTNYGIGWRSGVNDQGRSWLGHSGGSVGGITMFAMYPDEEIVVALCSNSSDHQWDGIHHILASLFSTAQ
jgi:CubicO group peptidase (beta-lactamase class C family)